MKLLRDLYPHPEKRRFGFILASYTILFSASIISGGVFLWLNDGSLPILSMIIISELIALLLMSFPILIMANRHTRPREKLKRSIRNFGDGCFCDPIDLDKEKMYSDIAESINEAGQKLTDKMQPIFDHIKHLSAVEEELSACLKADTCVDSHTKALICQLKICTSRLHNDLTEFTLENSNRRISGNNKTKSTQSSISV